MGPLTFLNPAVLWGGLAGLVPILLHLWQRRRPRRVPFTDLRFLEEGQARRARRLALRQWLLLLLRVLAILSVVAAAARPRLGGSAALPGGAMSLVAVLDASASMQTQEEDGTRFAQAVRACAALAGALPGGSELQVVLAGAAPVALLADWQPPGGALEAALTAALPEDGGCDLAAALREAARWSARARHAPVQVAFFSDLQLSAALPDSVALGEAARLFAAPRGARLAVQGVGRAAENGGVRAVRLPARALRSGEPLRIAADVRVAHAPESYLVELDGRRVAEAVAQGPPGGTTGVEFALTAPAPGLHRGQVVKATDRFPVDDAFPFVLAVRERLDVLIVHGPDRGEPAGRGGWRHLASALDPGPEDGSDAPPLFAVRALPTEAVGSGDLAAADVVCFVDPGRPNRDLLGGLRARLEGGGGVFLCLGDPTQADDHARLLLPALGLPGRLEWTVREGAAQERGRVLAPAHPVFAGLGEESLATLAEARWRRFFRLAEGDSTQVLLALAGGAPALIAVRAGAANVCVVPANLAPGSSDLPYSPMFLPLVQRLVAWLAWRGATEGRVTVGESPRVPLPAAPGGGAAAWDPSALRVLAPPPGVGAGAAVARPLSHPVALAWRGGAPWLEAGPAKRRGFYVFTAGADTVGLVAAASPAAESEPELASPSSFIASLAATSGLKAGELAAAPAGDLARALFGRDLSPALLLLAMALLGLELAVAHPRGGRREPA